MAWQGLHISRPAGLRLRQGRVEIDQEGSVSAFPLEDVAWIVIDTPQATATAALLSACATAGIAVVLSDERHMPCGMVLPFHQHFKQGETARRQIAVGDPFKKRIWQGIVRHKIENQADALVLRDPAGGDVLREIARHVRSGDPDNVEARAAREYWGRLFDDFRRQDDGDRRNALLNYGYAVLRGAIARTLAGYGFLPALGIHHDGAQNAFNLADDLIEPYRPFVDAMARAMSNDRPDDGKSGTLVLDDRRALAGVLSMNAKIGNDTMTILAAADRTAASLARAFESGLPEALELPRFTP